MTDRYIVFDVETKDPYLKELGAGWATGTGEVLLTCFKVKGRTAVHAGEGVCPAFINNFPEGTHLVAHNIMYDLGWYLDTIKNLDNLILVDTMLLAKLYNNTEKSYSLDYLSQKYLGEKKKHDELAQWCIDSGYIPNVKVGQMKRAKTFAMKNLDLLPKDLVLTYCEQDVILTERLYEFYLNKIPTVWIERLSNCIKAMVTARKRGVPINVKQLFNVSKTMKRKINKIYEEILQTLQSFGFPLDDYPEVNLKSPILMREVADFLSLPYDLSPKGNPIFNEAWLAKQSHPFCKLLKEYKRYQVSYNNFCIKLIKQQRLLPVSKRGYIYPEFKIFGASATGRMSSNSPNVQQVPGRDEKIGPLIRSIYTAEGDTKWLSCDFSSQETVLQVHYAKLIDAPGVDEMIHQYLHDPSFDFHTYGASICGLSRKEAKAINLGKAYGMGIPKMAASLGVSAVKAKEVINQYDSEMPYLVTLMSETMDKMKKRGFIKTILGRVLKNDTPIWDKEKGGWISFEYKALNKLIQGSAADQMYECISQCWQQKIPILFAVHDEINFLIPKENQEKEIKKRIKIMETSLDLQIPMKADYGVGSDWAEAK